MGVPIPVYPGAIVTDAQLKRANNQIKTTLAVACGPTDTVLTVTSAGGFVPNSLISVDNEIIAIAAVSSGANTLSVATGGRGFDGTNAAQHSSGAAVSMFIVAWHHDALVTEVEAIEATLGANLANVSGGVVTPKNWCQSPGGSLGVGVNTITLAPVPLGVNATNWTHYLWISGGTGTPEAVLITGGTAVSGAGSGTVTVTCAYSHSGPWSICSATAGIQEAYQLLATGGGGGTVSIPPGSNAIHGPIVLDVSGIRLSGAGMNSTQLLADLNVTPVIQIGTGNHGVPNGVQLEQLTVTRVSGAIPTNSVGVLWNFFNYGYSVCVQIYNHYIGEELACNNTSSVSLGFFSAFAQFWNNSYAHITIPAAAGVQYISPTFGKNIVETVSPTYGCVMSGLTNDILFQAGVFEPVASGSQWCIAWLGLTSSTGVFRFLDCNGMNWAQGMFMSNSATAEVQDLQVIGGWLASSASSGFFIKFDPATKPVGLYISNVSLAGQMTITNGHWTTISDNFISGAMTMTGGDALVANNTFATGPVFNGTFTCLNLVANSFVFNASAPVLPDLSTASGRIYVDSSNATDQPSAQPVMHSMPIAPAVAAASTITPTGNIFQLTGTGPISVINRPAAFYAYQGMITMIPSAACQFASGGNIGSPAFTATPFVPIIGICVLPPLVANPTWYLK